MRRIFELHGRRVECETRQVDANCWELRVTEEEGTQMDSAATTAQREWVAKGWQPPPFDNWIPTTTDFAK